MVNENRVMHTHYMFKINSKEQFVSRLVYDGVIF